MNNLLNPAQAVKGNSDPSSYSIKYTTVGFTNSSITTPVAERQVVFNYN